MPSSDGSDLILYTFYVSSTQGGFYCEVRWSQSNCGIDWLSEIENKGATTFPLGGRQLS